MKNTREKLTRRRFVTIGVVAGMAPIPIVLGTRAMAAGELPRLDEADGTAKALSYVHDASSIDAASRGGADRICKTCNLYTDASAAWGPCPLFPGKAVSAAGWCKGWVKRST